MAVRVVFLEGIVWTNCHQNLGGAKSGGAGYNLAVVTINVKRLGIGVVVVRLCVRCRSLDFGGAAQRTRCRSRCSEPTRHKLPCPAVPRVQGTDIHDGIRIGEPNLAHVGPPIGLSVRLWWLAETCIC